MTKLVPIERIASKIYLIRDIKVMLDKDLAELYGVETRVLNQAVKRHKKRFPEDFMFQLSKSEYDFLISQFVTSKKSGRGGARKMPYAFTEQGVAMLSGILNSDRAIAVNIQIMRAFTQLRQMLSTHKDLKRWKRNMMNSSRSSLRLWHNYWKQMKNPKRKSVLQ